MEGQLQRTHDHHRHEEDDPHHYAGLQSVRKGEVEAEHNHHGGEKKSVLTKVKNKAKKIKDKIKHAGHAQEDDDYDYDDDEETVDASHLHGAPMVNETDFISGTALPKQTGPKLENPTVPLDDRQSPSAREDDVYDDVGNVGATRNEMYPNIGMRTSPLLEDPYIRKQEYSLAGDVRVGTGTSPNTDLLDPLPTSTAATASEQRANVAEPMVKIGPLTDMEEDPYGPNTNTPSNYQSKVADPTGQGGEEADVAPLLQRLDKLHVEPETGSEERAYTQKLINDPKSFDAERAESMPRDTVAGKISAAASVVTEKASSAKNAAASKLGYSRNEGGRDFPEKTALESASEYGHRVAEQLAPVYEKAAGAGSAIMARVQRRGGAGAAKESDRGVSVQEYLVEKFSPGEEDRELSKVITDAIHGKKELGAQPEAEKGRIEAVRVEAVAGDEKAAAGVVDRVRGAIGSWLGKKQGDAAGEEGLEKEIASRLQE